MIDTNDNPQHHVQRYILDVLRHQEFARFRDLRPAGTDSNAFSYHLTQLKKQSYVQLAADGYTLTLRGLAYIDRVSRLDTRPRRQPKIMTISLVYNQYGDVLAYPKPTQPMIGQLTLPTGMLHMTDLTIAAAARREVSEKTGLSLDGLTHAGDCYMAVRSGAETVMNSLMHVFKTVVLKESVQPKAGVIWYDPADTAGRVAPASARLLALAAVTASEPAGRFFAEFSIDWPNL